MIGQLVRTRFESNLTSFVVFIALIVLTMTRYLVMRETPQGAVTREAIMVVAGWLMLGCFAAGIVSLLRQTRERSSRLYAQLPVSPQQVRAAYWLHVVLYPGIVAVLLEAFVLFGGSETPAAVEFHLVPVILFFTICTWLACLSLVTSNISRLIPGLVRQNTVLYCFVVTVATMILGYAVIFATVALVGTGPEAPTDLRTAAMIIAAWCAILITLDMYLYARSDRNLD